MANGAQIGCKRKVQLENEGSESDESDKDYKASEDEELQASEDEYCSSLVGDESENSLLELCEEEEEVCIENKVEKVGQVRKKNRIVKPRKKRVTRKEEKEDYSDGYEDDEFFSITEVKKNKASHSKEDDDDAHFSSEEDDESSHRKPKRISRVSRAISSGNTDSKNRRKKNKAEAKEESDHDDEDDVEFTPSEIVLDRATRRTRVRRQVLTRHDTSNASDEKPTTVRKKKRTARGKRKFSIDSNSHIANSGSSDHEYTISEEEREQIGESSKLCSGLSIGSRSSGPSRINNEETQRKQQPIKKGKEKVPPTKVEAPKQVCGICLSEEGKRTIRGFLNCCNHYFCFLCIMEWSKVESRCPLCKQRFTVINRKVRSDGGRDSRDADFQVPERDQVYQPSEEELMGYLDPYEGVMCCECHLGGDDALMLLCDLCDSPAHTYCVGLGHEVPEGNWYCDGCLPTVYSSSNPQALNPTADNGTANTSSVRGAFDLNEAYVPETQIATQAPDREFSSFFPSAALTVERWRIQRQSEINRSISTRDRGNESNESTGQPVSGISLFGFWISSNGTVTARPGSIISRSVDLRGRSEYNSSLLLASGVSSSNGQGEASASDGLSYAGPRAQNGVLGVNETSGAGFVHQLLHPCLNRSNNGNETREGTAMSSRTSQGPVYTHQF